jgi:hypothetical protein
MGKPPSIEIEHAAESGTGSLVFPGLDRADRLAWVRTVREKGYCVGPQLLSPEARAELIEFAKTASGSEWTSDGSTSRQVRFDQLAPDAARLSFDGGALLALAHTQRLVSDPGLLAFLQDYFGRTPLLDTVNMWWSIAADRPPSAEIAQMYHYDLDRVRWLKLFVYLTDVNPDTGPHVFIEGSHRPEGQVSEILSRGYVRIPDQDAEASYGADRVKEICGPAGTMLIVDTKGMHKGKAPTRGNRLIFELQFSSCGFGADYPPMRLAGSIGPSLSAAMERYPRTYGQISLSGA